MGTWAIHHSSLSVSNMEASLKFYRDGLGLEVVADAEERTERLALQVQVADAYTRMIWLKAPEDDSLVELMEYKNPKGRAYASKCNDIGAPHISFLVDDIQETYDKLVSMGYKPTTEPQDVDENTQPGSKTVYFYDPDGIPVELFQISAERRAKKLYY